MSKVMKKYMMRDYEDRIGDTEDALLISVRGVPANDNNRLRLSLRKDDIDVVVIRNDLAKHVFADSKLSSLTPLLEGPSALAFGGETVIDVARSLVKWAKEIENLELKGAVLDGELFEGHEGVERLSNFPTREEAIANLVTLILSPGRNIAGAVSSPGGNIAGILKTVQEKRENGEAIEKVA